MRLVPDDVLTIAEHTKECVRLAEDRGFKNPTFSDAISLLHSEVSEAYEEYRNNHDFKEIYYNDGKPEGIPIEFADLAIRLFHYCGFYGIDLEEAINIKQKYNITRPYKHGNKKA